MGLEMQVHKDVAAFEAKPMFGLTWRGLAGMAIIVFVGAVVFFAVSSAVIVASGSTWGDVVAATLSNSGESAEEAAVLKRATTIGMYSMLPIVFPVAVWAWHRPKGMMPEQYAQYFIRYQVTSGVIHYADTYTHTSAAAVERESVPAGGPDGAPEQPSRRRASSRRRGRTVVSEHAPKPGRGADTGR